MTHTYLANVKITEVAHHYLCYENRFLRIPQVGSFYGSPLLQNHARL